MLPLGRKKHLDIFAFISSIGLILEFPVPLQTFKHGKKVQGPENPKFEHFLPSLMIIFVWAVGLLVRRHFDERSKRPTDINLLLEIKVIY